MASVKQQFFTVVSNTNKATHESNYNAFKKKNNKNMCIYILNKVRERESETKHNNDDK